MPSIVPVTYQRHGCKRWQRFSRYTFAAQDAVTPLALAELAKAATALPIAFIRQSDRLVPAAVMGVQNGENLMVSATGSWLGRYVPASYRSYPFMLVKASDGQQVMCVDESSGLVSDEINGEPIFAADSQPSQVIKDILTFLDQTSASRNAAMVATDTLQKHNLIEPWPLTVRSTSGEQRVEGLCRVDEGRLNSLAADALLEVRDTGALVVAYLQLFSMQHIDELASLVRKRNEAAQSNGATIGAIGDTFSFGNLN